MNVPQIADNGADSTTQQCNGRMNENYRDYAQEQGFFDPASIGRIADHPFPVKLHYMLTETEKDGLEKIVSWQPHGRCFVVHDQKLFVQRILPCWFRQTKFSSFQRQLNLYGFRRITNATDKGGYYHELFLRCKPQLCYSIKRTKIKGTGTRKPSCPETEPNFYLMTFLPESKSVDNKANTSSATSQISTDNNANHQTPIASGVDQFLQQGYPAANVLASILRSSIQTSLALQLPLLNLAPNVKANPIALANGSAVFAPTAFVNGSQIMTHPFGSLSPFSV